MYALLITAVLATTDFDMIGAPAPSSFEMVSPKEPTHEVSIDHPRAVVVYSRKSRPTACLADLAKWNFVVIERDYASLSPGERDLALPNVKYKDRNGAWHNWYFCEP